MQRHRVTVFADYFQFYLWDKDRNPEAPVGFTDEDVLRRVKVAPHVVVIQLVRNMEVPVELEVRGTRPDDETSDWDHVVQCSIDVPSGNLQVHECTGGAVADIRVKPGTYMLMALFRGLDRLSDNGLDGKDQYRIVLWPGQACEIEVLKQWAA